MEATPKPIDTRKISEARNVLVDELPVVLRAFIDTVRAEGTSQAYDRLASFALKAVPDLQVNAKPDQYANLPTIHFTIGPGLAMTTTVAAAPVPAPDADITDVEPKSQAPAALMSPIPAEVRQAAQEWLDSLPDDPLDLLEVPETLAALTAAAGAMAMPDD
jgi:hypothetical protein